jgi:tetratricopeptide (TPR) repeat protein
MGQSKLARQKIGGYLLCVLLVPGSFLVAQAQLTAKRSTATDAQQLLAAAERAKEAGRFDEAIRVYNQVVSLSAQAPSLAATAQLKIGDIHMAQRKFENAAVAYQKAVTLNPSSAEGYNNLGEALGELRQFPQAINAFNRAVSLDSQLLKARYNQGVTYDRMGNKKYSEFVFRSLIKSAPRYALAYDGLAVTLSKAGRAKEALVFHEQAITLAPQEASYHFNLAISYLILGNTPKALEQQEKLNAIDSRVADQLASVIVKRKL